MMGKLRMAVLMLLVIPGLLFTASCSKKVVKADEAAAAGQATGPGGTAMNKDDLARQQAIDEERLRQERLRQEEEERLRREREGSGSGERERGDNIYFAYDSAALSSEAQEVLRQKAEWLRSNAGVSVRIEGHCDERGTNEYNMALGDRRAESAKSFLVNLGIAASRLNTVSYGEERPADSGHDESAWSKNRRAHFVTE